jgi:hypothetical protein
MFQTKVLEKIATSVLCSITLFQKSRRLWNHTEIIVEPARPRCKIQRMHISRWYLRLQTNKEYVIHFLFSTATVVALMRLSVTCICPPPPLFSLSESGHRAKHNIPRELNFLFCKPAQNKRCVFSYPHRTASRGMLFHQI